MDQHPTPALDARALRVGIAGSMTGRRVAHAQAFRAAQALLQQRGIDATLGDDTSTPQRAQALAAEFAGAGVQLVIGHFNSACARAAMPVYREHGIELLLPASTDVGLAVGDGVHRLCANDAAQAVAIGRWARERGQALPGLQVRTDGSDYAARLLASLQAELAGVPCNVSDVTDAAAPIAPLCVVLAVAHNALGFVQAAHFPAGQGTVVFSDEAAVAEVTTAAARSGADCWVVTPQPSYEALLEQACRQVAQWHALGCPHGRFTRWAAMQGALLSNGEAAHAAWTLRRCA